MYFTKSIALFPAMLMLMLAGCGGSQQTAPPQEPEPTAFEDGVNRMQAVEPSIDSQEPWVTASELKCMTDDFNKYIHVGTPASHAPIQLRALPLTVGVGALQALVSGLKCSKGDLVSHGVLLHYGLDGRMGFDVMLQLVCTDHYASDSTYTYDEPKEGYTLDGTGALVLDTNALAKWYASKGPGTRYAANVVLDHNANDQWTAFNKDKDVRSTIFPYQLRLTELIKDNDLGADDLLRIVPVAEPRTRREDGEGGYVETGYHQGAAWVPEGVTLDDKAYVNTPYKNKAADLGHPCPYTCPKDKFKFRDKGLPPRSSC